LDSAVLVRFCHRFRALSHAFRPPVYRRFPGVFTEKTLRISAFSVFFSVAGCKFLPHKAFTSF
jgi:hypothetical protein